MNFPELDNFQLFIVAAFAVDRKELETIIRLSDSDLGKQIASRLLPESQKAGLDAGVAMMKLTAFYLTELHKLFDETPPTGTRIAT